MRTFRLVIACPDGVGIVAKVSNFLASHNGWITEASHHSDDQSGWFFMRHEIRADSLPFGLRLFVRHLPRLPKSFDGVAHYRYGAEKTRGIDGQP
jgi:formyltetrahydrofolate deformylase